MADADEGALSTFGLPRTEADCVSLVAPDVSGTCVSVEDMMPTLPEQ